MNKPQRRDAPDLSVVRELLGDIPGESIEDAAVRVAARLQAEIDLRRAVEAERDQARKELAAALAEFDGAVALAAERFEAACHLNHQRADELEAAAAAANKRRALLLCAARAACKRLRLRVGKWRQCAEDVTAVADDYRSRLAAALARAYDTERLYRRAEDQRAAAESALETLEGQATLAEESVQAATNELAEGRAALSFARTVHARQRRWIIWGKLRRERDRRAVRRLRKECEQLRRERDRASDAADRFAGKLYRNRRDLNQARAELERYRTRLSVATVALCIRRRTLGRVRGTCRRLRRERDEIGRLLAIAEAERQQAARAALARRLRASFATETPDHCSNDHAFPGAFRALSTRTCSGAGDQPCTGEQSSPEPAGESLADWARAWIDGGGPARLARELADPCSPAQPARPIRAGREGRGAGRFPRGGGRPGMAEVTPRAETRKVGEMTLVAKAGPSPADRESAVNQGERARLGNPECATGALAGGPEPRAGASGGWFGSTGEGERVELGSELRQAAAVFGAVDLLWWLCLRLAFLCGVRAPGEIGVQWTGIGWRDASVPGGALAEAWIGVVPATEDARDGWPVGWAWRLNPLEPPDWVDVPDCDDRAPFEPGSVGVLVKGPDGAAKLAAWATAWGDRWTAPGFDAARLVRLLRAELTDAELRAEERDDEDDPDAPEPAAASSQPAWMQDAPPLPAGLVWGWDGLWMKVFDPSGDEVASAVHDGKAWCWKARERWATAKNRRAAMLKIAEALATQEAEQRNAAAAAVVAAERPPATCRTGQEPADSRVADLPVLREGYRWEALTDSSAQVMTSAEIGRGSCVAELYPINSSEGVAGWFWSVAAWLGHDGESDVSPTRQEAAGNVARVLRRATTGEG